MTFFLKNLGACGASGRRTGNWATIADRDFALAIPAC